MKTITIKGWVHGKVATDSDRYESESWRANVVGEIAYEFRSFKNVDGEKLLGEASITIEVPDDFNPVQEAIDALEAEKRQLLADTQMKVNAINGQISKFQALIYEAPEVPA